MEDTECLHAHELTNQDLKDGKKAEHRKKDDRRSKFDLYFRRLLDEKTKCGTERKKQASRRSSRSKQTPVHDEQRNRCAQISAKVRAAVTNWTGGADTVNCCLPTHTHTHTHTHAEDWEYKEDNCVIGRTLINRLTLDCQKSQTTKLLFQSTWWLLREAKIERAEKTLFD